MAALSAQAEETRETLRRLRKVQCAGFHNPYLIVGIDWSKHIDGQEVTGFGKWPAFVADWHSSHTKIPPVPIFCLLVSRKLFTLLELCRYARGRNCRLRFSLARS
jgi:hypothetical protein